MRRRPARGWDTKETLIHRSSPLLGSTDAYEAGILADAVTLLMDESQTHQPCSLYGSRDALGELVVCLRQK